MKHDGKQHLPLYGVGPVIVYGQFAITAISILLVHFLKWDFAQFEVLNLPLRIIGVILILFGFYLDICAKYRSRLFDKVANNKLITDGVYGIVRNPIYSGMWIVCIGVVLIANNLLLLAVPFICWGYMTLFLIATEEKWLLKQYGQEYADYCKRVNRCIPWFPRKQVIRCMSEDNGNEEE